MSATRLLLLGAVRVFQPVHGYFLRRELLTWHADAWAHVNPGSVYNGLRSLVRAGFLEELGTEAEGGRPARTMYRLTNDGESEFHVLLRRLLWNVSAHDPAEFLTAWSFASALRREEVIEALEHRTEQIDAARRFNEYGAEDMLRIEGKPDQVAEHFRLTQARLDGEAQWIRQVLERLRAGEYAFAGEEAPGTHAAGVSASDEL